MVLCGVISSYLTGEHPGPANYVNLLAKTATMQGFNALDEWDRFDEAFAALRRWEAEGLLVHRETVFDGLESCVDALNGLFTGANIGKMLVKVSEPVGEATRVLKLAQLIDVEGRRTPARDRWARRSGSCPVCVRRGRSRRASPAPPMPVSRG